MESYKNRNYMTAAKKEGLAEGTEDGKTEEKIDKIR